MKKSTIRLSYIDQFVNMKIIKICNYFSDEPFLEITLFIRLN